jgi:hypothetical protein
MVNDGDGRPTITRPPAGEPVHRRHSFLKRNPALTMRQFREHYEYVHGPLAAAQTGFRKYTLRYMQNHVEGAPDGHDGAFDGITVTTQRPREDYSRGFFNEPDYENVKADEQYLFAIERTVTVPGVEILRVQTGAPSAGAKAVVLLGDERDARKLAEFAAGLPGLMRATVSELATQRASALGFRSAQFAFHYLVECWFATEDKRVAALAGSLADGSAIALPVREVLIFGPERPWQSVE